MASRQRLTIASMWAFEDIGVQEIQREFKKARPEFDSLCEYSRPDNVLIIKGDSDGAESKFVSLISDFIEEQKNKDLLEMPRIRQLEVPAMFDDGTDPIAESPEKIQEGDLLALDGDSEEEVVPNVIGGVTKSWLSPKGGLGCFSTGFQDVLAEVAALTGTRISVVNDRQGIQVTGKNSADVDDAVGKLTRIENALSLIGNPRTMNMMVASEGDIRLRIKSYTTLNNIALRRILTDPNASTNVGLHQTYVSVLHYFDSETQSFTVPENLLNPPHATNEPGPSRIWNDFTFQELGKGDDFLSLQSIMDKDPANPQAPTTAIAPPHPYLTAEKASQVNKWRVDMGTAEPVPEPNDALQPVETPMPPPPVRKAPGIKTRRAVPQGQVVQQTTADASVEVKPTVLEEIKASAPDIVQNDPIPPRRKWTMTYQPLSNENANSSGETTNQAAANSNSAEAAGTSLFDRPKTPEAKPRVLVNFDATKYGLSKNAKYTPKTMRTGITAQKVNSPSKIMPNRNSGKRDLLIDVFAPTTNTQPSSQPLISFDQPALIPQNLLNLEYTEDPFAQNQTAIDMSSKHSSDKTGEDSPLGNGIELLGSNSPNSAVQTTSAIGESFEENERRLLFLKKLLQEQEQERGRAENSNARQSVPTRRSRYTDPEFIRERLAELEKGHKPEGKQAMDEVATREFHRTMLHRAAKSSEKAKAKKAKRQATLEDAWGIPKKSNKATLAETSGKPTALERNVNQPSKSVETKGTRSSDPMNPDVQRQQQLEEEMSMIDHIRRLFEELEPTFDAAEYFPGTLTLESQIGLILIPLLPKTYSEGVMISANEWNRIFQPRNGLPAPTTKFISRLTSSGADVDYIVDLKKSKEEGRTRLFEQEYTDYSVSYEYHCRTSTDRPIVITIDENGKFTIRKPTKTLGAVNLHFPRQTWDASMILNGITEHAFGSDKETEDAVQHLIDNLWVQPDRSLVRIFTRLPKGNKLVIEKVFMKRWTRHRYIRPGDTAPKNTDTASVASRGAMVAEKNEPNSSGDQDSLANENDSENQDLFLQITEVQDLFLGISPSDSQAVRASCAPLPEMIKKGRQWYEVSIVSPAIETILKANCDLEVGERTNDWKSENLLGKDAPAVLYRTHLFEPLLSSSSSSSSAAAFLVPLTSVASAIGNAGLGEMFRLTKTVVEKIDGVGYFNVGPGVEAARIAAAAAGGTILAPSTALGALVKADRKGVDFDELESIKEVGSASQVAPADAAEQEELEYW